MLAVVCSVSVSCAVGEVGPPCQEVRLSQGHFVHPESDLFANYALMPATFTYPFEPKSTSKLCPGHYWTVPFSNGRYACGRVLQVGIPELMPKTRAFFGGLHDWTSDSPPTPDAISGSGFVEYGVMHVRAIQHTGGEVLGMLSLDEERAEMPTLMSCGGGPGTQILSGCKPVRLAKKTEWGKLPVISYWGYGFIQELAEYRWGSG